MFARPRKLNYMNPAAQLVLHVDDDPSDTLLLQQACRKAQVSFQLKSVADGETAVAYLAGRGAFSNRGQHPLPALLLLDLKMPRMTGFDVLAWARAQAHFKLLPIIILTASNQDEDIKRAYETGANSYLVKPVGIHTLTEMARLIDAYWLGLNQQVNVAG